MDWETAKEKSKKFKVPDGTHDLMKEITGKESVWGDLNNKSTLSIWCALSALDERISAQLRIIIKNHKRLHELEKKSKLPRRKAPLNANQKQILKMVKKGISQKEISIRFGKTPSAVNQTVKILQRDGWID